jgi:hypothetical protein
MKTYLFTIFFVIASLLIPKAAFASCAKKSSVEDSAKQASVIFIGTVTKINRAEIARAVYSFAPKAKWERRDENVDVVTFSVREAFKGVTSETIDITTATDGFAGYKFEGGTWLKEGQTYLVYADKRLPAGVAPDFKDEDYGKEVAADFRAMHKAFPKKLAAEINEFNNRISPYESSICTRSVHINSANEDLEQLRKMFPSAKQFSTQTDTQEVNLTATETTTFLSRLLSFLGLA